MDGGMSAPRPGALALADLGFARDRLRQMVALRSDTSIAAVTADVAGRPVTIRLKLEGESRWGSIKDRTAMSLLASVLDGLGGAPPVVVESTSGNLGAALAAICADLRLRFIAVVDPLLSPVRVTLAIDVQVIPQGCPLSLTAVTMPTPVGNLAIMVRRSTIARFLPPVTPGGIPHLPWSRRRYS